MTAPVVEEVPAEAEATSTTATTAAPEAKKRVPMPREEREANWPSLKSLAGPASKAGEQAWVAAFTLKPEAMYHVLQDIIKQTYATPGRIGQRPMPKEEEVDLEGLLYGDFAENALVVELPKLMKGMSQRAFCRKIFMSQSQFQRLLTGDYQPTMNEIRLIATAVRKHPVFFVEYRVMAAQAAFFSMLAERPHIATKLYRTCIEVKSPPRRRTS